MRGVVLGSAAGDALGAPYEFQPPLPDEAPVEFRAGGPWERGEWTDDTAMSVPVLEALAAGRDLGEDETLGGIVRRWIDWSHGSKDVGIQTREVLAITEASTTGQSSNTEVAVACRAAARRVHERTGRSAGNGSLMRTGPVALGCLDDPDALVRAARAVSDLTHFEQDAVDACVLWSLAIRQAVLTGEHDLHGQVEALPPDRRTLWLDRIAQSERLQPHQFPHNGWVVAALQAAWSAIVHGDGLQDTLERAVRSGYDTDTVAAIAGSLAGARYGASGVPEEWQQALHGWPALTGADLADLAGAAIR